MESGKIGNGGSKRKVRVPQDGFGDGWMGDGMDRWGMAKSGMGADVDVDVDEDEDGDEQGKPPLN